MRSFTTTRGETFTTTLSDVEAFEIVSNVRGNFAQSLVSQIRNGRALSARQLPWLHKLAIDELRRTNEIVATRETPATRYTAIVSLMQSAAQHLQRPKVRFVLESGNVQFSIAGSSSRYDGKIIVTDGGGYGSNVFYGVIALDGSFTAHRSSPEWIVAALDALNENPASYAAAYGRRVGACCFCSRTLTTSESLTVGYGPICADHFGLSWGERLVETSPNAIVAAIVAAGVAA